jgi:hypothetical protein
MNTLMQLINPPCQDAITRALHNANVIDFHKRHGIGTDCPICPPTDPELQERIEDTMEEISKGGGDQQLATEMSPALKNHLEERELTPDPPTYEYAEADLSKKPTDENFAIVDADTVDGMVEVGSFAEKTVKQLRPLASAAGMQGARVAVKAELVAYLEGV